MDESLPYRVAYSAGGEQCQKCRQEIGFGCLRIAIMVQVFSSIISSTSEIIESSSNNQLKRSTSNCLCDVSKNNPNLFALFTVYRYHSCCIPLKFLYIFFIYFSFSRMKTIVATQRGTISTAFLRPDYHRQKPHSMDLLCFVMNIRRPFEKI